MLDFNIPSIGLCIEDREVYNINRQLRDEITNGPFRRDWILKLNHNYINQLEKGQEYLIVGEYGVKIHPYLRRFLHSKHSINVDLITRLCDIGNQYSDIKIGLAIDPDYVQTRDQIFQIVELEKAFGLDYNLQEIIKRLLRDRKKIKSVYHRGEHTGLKVLIGLKDKNLIEFNIYEFTLNKANNHYINRSVHANYDIKLGYYSHIDGKALLYEEKGYHPLGMKIIKRPKRKLFRLDGIIPEEFFISLSTRFFFENDLISEFFHPENIENNLIRYMVNNDTESLPNF